MNPLSWIMTNLALAKWLAFVLAVLAFGWKMDRNGSQRVKARWELHNVVAQAALDAANVRVEVAQKRLNDTAKVLKEKEDELAKSNQKSVDLERAYAVGTQRLRVRTSGNCPQQAQSETAGKVDQGTSVVQDLHPSVAAGLERLRRNENAAIDRLNACVIQYEELEKAVNSL